jgi:ankyrin repeat protein
MHLPLLVCPLSVPHSAADAMLQGITPLGTAIANDQAASVECLLAYGVSPESPVLPLAPSLPPLSAVPPLLTQAEGTAFLFIKHVALMAHALQHCGAYRFLLAQARQLHGQDKTHLACKLL